MKKLILAVLFCVACNSGHHSWEFQVGDCVKSRVGSGPEMVVTTTYGAEDWIRVNWFDVNNDLQSAGFYPEDLIKINDPECAN